MTSIAKSKSEGAVSRSCSEKGCSDTGQFVVGEAICTNAKANQSQASSPLATLHISIVGNADGRRQNVV